MVNGELARRLLRRTGHNSAEIRAAAPKSSRMPLADPGRGEREPKDVIEAPEEVDGRGRSTTAEPRLLRGEISKEVRRRRRSNNSEADVAIACNGRT